MSISCENPFEHSVSATCSGEWCQMCNSPATHKVCEEIPVDRPQWNMRHSFTAYVCCRCFGRIFGMIAVNWCDTGEIIPTIPPMIKSLKGGE